MQSGISASSELHSAFNSFTSDSSLFALPITITSERLESSQPIPFSSSDFTSSLSALRPHLQPKTPTYLLLRQSASPSSLLVAITYIPYNAPVRQKTLYASTRASLVRDLGLEKFGESLFVTEAEEVLDARQWQEREGAKTTSAAEAGLLSAEERELQGVKRAEEEERHGTMGRDLMGLGGSGAAPQVKGGSSSSGIKMKITDEASAALRSIGEGAEGGTLVQLGIDISTEMLTLVSPSSSVSPAQVSSKIPSSRPSYTFYRDPTSTSIFFVYACPSSSKVKERMLYASSRASLLELAKQEGVAVAKRIEVSEPSEVGEERLKEELAPKVDESSARQGFARPKRPGRR